MNDLYLTKNGFRKKISWTQSARQAQSKLMARVWLLRRQRKLLEIDPESPFRDRRLNFMLENSPPKPRSTWSMEAREAQSLRTKAAWARRKAGA